MLRDGIYQMIYSGAAYSARGMFVFRKGSFVGLGQTGAIYEGAYWSDPASQAFDFDGCVRFPPRTELVTGGPVSGDQELIIPFKGSGRMRDGQANFTLAFNNEPVEVAMTFVSPIPG